MVLDEFVDGFPVLSPGVSRSTIGTGTPLPVWVSVSSSNVSSSVPKPPGRHTNAGDLLHQHQLAGEEVLHADVLGVAGDDEVGALLERQPDRHADRALPPGALHAGLHDPGPGAGDDHPAALGQRRGDVAGLLVERVVRVGAGRAEDRDLAHVRVRRRTCANASRISGDRRGGDLQVEACRADRRADPAIPRGTPPTAAGPSTRRGRRAGVPPVRRPNCTFTHGPRLYGARAAAEVGARVEVEAAMLTESKPLPEQGSIESPSILRGIAVGVLSTFAGLAAAEVVTGLFRGASSPILPVGQKVIDATPRSVGSGRSRTSARPTRRCSSSARCSR